MLIVSTWCIARWPLLGLVAVFVKLWHFVDFLCGNYCFLAYLGFNRYCLRSLLLYFVRFLLRNIKRSLSTISFSACSPCVLQIFGLFFTPESPRWLVSCLWSVSRTHEEPHRSLSFLFETLIWIVDITFHSIHLHPMLTISCVWCPNSLFDGDNLRVE